MVKAKSSVFTTIKLQEFSPKTVKIFNKKNQLISRIEYYPTGEKKHVYKYSPLAKHKLKESIGYNRNGKINSFKRFYGTSGYCFENFKLQPNGYFRDMTRKTLKHYFKFKENFDNDDYYLTVKAYNIINGRILKRDTMIFKNNYLNREKFYDENGRLRTDGTVKY